MRRVWIAVVAWVGCEPAHGPAAAPPDAASDVAPDAALPCDVAKPFAAPTPLSSVNTDGEDNGAWLSPDQLMIYFTRAPGDYTTRDIYVAGRAAIDQPFGA